MKFTEYQERTEDTDRLMEMSRRSRIELYLAGLFSEAGEVSDATKLTKKKVTAAVRDELGDVLWYVTRLASAFDLDLGSIAEYNLAKLRAKYPLEHES